ncbi:TetR/AcrR family transcriptional regulator [Streptacidiphilus sp. N1-12]|uniref:TetR/AcrR family transcriptional regulator n=2 Tax=Streptacidiphilus alkalitolerans TaxID=3342712 RepID=A0ABV6XBB9_9ACTN
MTDTLDAQPAAPLGRRERNKIKVMARLYEAAISLFAEQGYDETSIDEIAERADVARGTFFNYFQRKEDLLCVWGEKRRDTLLATMAADGVVPDCAVGRLRHCMTALAQINEAHRHETNALLMAWVRAGRPLLEDPYLADLFAEVVAGGVESGEFRSCFTAEQIGHALRDLYLGTLYRWCGQPEEPADRLTGELLTTLDLILQGILVDRPPEPAS